jgi:hypothetical protein
MHKLTGVFAIALLLAGCTGNNSGTVTTTTSSSAIQPTSSSADSSIEPSPMQSAEPSDVASTTPPSESPIAPIDVAQLTSTFAFANEEGTQLITLTLDPQGKGKRAESSESLNKAIGDNGTILDITFIKHQKSTEEDNGRQSAYNFSHLEGDVYEISVGKAKPNESYYLIDDRSFDVRSLIAIKLVTPDEPPATVTDEILVAKNRTIDRSWKLAETEDGQQIFLVQFERQGDQMLASLAVKRQEQWTFMDYPATYDATSTWGLEDQGELSPDMFSFLFAARTKQGLMLGVKWMDSEGEIITLINQSGQQFTDTAIRSGRYLVPI